MIVRAGAGPRLLLLALLATLGGCAGGHQIQRLVSPGGRFVLLVDYAKQPFGTQDVIVSLEEKGGLAAPVAAFGNIQSFQAAWLGPEDVGICQMGTVRTYKTHLVLNASTGPQDFYIHYRCPLSQA